MKPLSPGIPGEDLVDPQWVYIATLITKFSFTGFSSRYAVCNEGLPCYT